MSNLKSFLTIVLTAIFLTVSTSSHAAHHAAILIDASDGSVIYETNATHAWFPASLTKVMTLYMTFSALNDGLISLNDRMTASPNAARQPNSKLGLRTNETITVEEAILALITRSANDASVVLAEHIGGSEVNFAVKMTAKAHDLGMFDTHFMNATGLPHDWQVTTPRDMAMLAWKTQRHFPNYYPYFAAHSFYFKGREMPGINKFTAKYPGAEGMKTGFTCGSGYNLISSASQNGRHLIGVVMGGMTSAERYQLMTRMMDNGFANPYGIGKNITSLTSSYAGSAPYLLGCGNHASTVLVNRPSPARSAAHHVRKVSAVKHSASKHSKASKHSVSHFASSKKAPSHSHKAIVKTKLASKGKASKTRYRRS
ncbi:hypothetical protein JCM14076_12140 [Methylosoma difficile]